MFDKIKKYFKSKNPYLLASFAIVMVSILVIVLLIQKDMPVGEDPYTAEVLAEVEENQETIVEEELPVETEAVVEVVAESTKETVSEETQEENIIEPEQPSKLENQESFTEKEVPPTKETIETVEETVVEESKETEKDADKPTEPEEPEKMETPPTEESEEIPEEKTEQVPEELPKETGVTEEEHEHSWSFDSYYQMPTCSNGGLVNQICAHCGETQTTVGTPTGEHLYQVEAPGDCCSAEVVICSECNHREVREKDPDNHIDEEDGLCYGCGCKTE